MFPPDVVSVTNVEQDIVDGLEVVHMVVVPQFIGLEQDLEGLKRASSLGRTIRTIGCLSKHNMHTTLESSPVKRLAIMSSILEADQESVSGICCIGREKEVLDGDVAVEDALHE